MTAAPAAWLQAIPIRSLWLIQRLLRSRQARLSVALLLVSLLWLLPRATVLVEREGRYALAAEVVLAVRGTFQWLLAWGLPSAPIQVPGYALAYLLLLVGVRAFHQGRQHSLRICPFRISEETGKPSGTTLASLLSDALESLRHSRLRLGPVVVFGNRMHGLGGNSQQIEIVVPPVEIPKMAGLEEIRVAGVSPRTAEDLVRYLLRSETVVTGDAVALGSRYRLIMRSTDAGRWESEIDLTVPDWGRAQFERLALRILRDTEPLVYVECLMAAERAVEAVSYLVTDGRRAIPDRDAWIQAVEYAAAAATWQKPSPVTSDEVLSLASDVAPRSATILNVRAGLLLRNERWKAAEKMARKAIRRARWSPAPRLTLAQALRAQGQYGQALRSALLAYWLEKRSRPVAQLVLGQVLLNLGQTTQAAWHLRRVVDAFPMEALPRVYLSYTEKSSRKQLAMLEQAVRIAPKDSSGHLALGLLLADHGELERAVRSLQEAVKLAPEKGDGHFWLYLALEKLERRAEAKTELEAARRLGSTYATEHFGRVEFSRRQWT